MRYFGEFFYAIKSNNWSLFMKIWENLNWNKLLIKNWWINTCRWQYVEFILIWHSLKIFNNIWVWSMTAHDIKFRIFLVRFHTMQLLDILSYWDQPKIHASPSNFHFGKSPPLKIWSILWHRFQIFITRNNAPCLKYLNMKYCSTWNKNFSYILYIYIHTYILFVYKITWKSNRENWIRHNLPTKLGIDLSNGIKKLDKNEDKPSKWTVFKHSYITCVYNGGNLNNLIFSQNSRIITIYHLSAINVHLEAHKQCHWQAERNYHTRIFVQLPS